MKNFVIITTLFLLFGFQAIAQEKILVIDYNNSWASDQSSGSFMYNRLVATQSSVTRINSIPASISNASYDQVWLFGDMGTPGAGNLNPIKTFMDGGGGVFIQSEVSCCNAQGDYAEALINSHVTGGGSITHNAASIKSSWFEYVPSLEAMCTSMPPAYGAAARMFIGMNTVNIMFEATNTCGGVIGIPDVMGVMFRSCDLINGSGALIIVGDFNMMKIGGACNTTANKSGNVINSYFDLMTTLMPKLRVCQTCSSTLGVDVTNFKAKCDNNKVELSWVTPSFLDNSDNKRHYLFTVEKSKDNVDFKKIGVAIGKENKQSSSTVQHFIDNDVKGGNSYYRIKQTDENSNIKYSDIVRTSCGSFEDFSLIPNPSNGDFKILLNDENLNLDDIEISIMDNIEGKKMAVDYKINYDSGEIVFNKSNLHSGIYIIRLTIGNKTVIRKLIIRP